MHADFGICHAVQLAILLVSRHVRDDMGGKNVLSVLSVVDVAGNDLELGRTTTREMEAKVC